MSTEGMPKPYMVAAFYGDDDNNNIGVGVQAAPSAANAAAQVVATYYMQGGKLPLVATHVFEVTRGHALAAIAMLDAIDAAEKAEADKVVGLREVPQEGLHNPAGNVRAPDWLGVDQNGLQPMPPDGAA